MPVSQIKKREKEAWKTETIDFIQEYQGNQYTKGRREWR
jgi:hypothetical protein